MDFSDFLLLVASGSFHLDPRMEGGRNQNPFGADHCSAGLAAREAWVQGHTCASLGTGAYILYSLSEEP